MLFSKEEKFKLKRKENLDPEILIYIIKFIMYNKIFI